jgi:hypothetical protein
MGHPNSKYAFFFYLPTSMIFTHALTPDNVSSATWIMQTLSCKGFATCHVMCHVFNITIQYAMLYEFTLCLGMLLYMLQIWGKFKEDKYYNLHKFEIINLLYSWCCFTILVVIWSGFVQDQCQLCQPLNLYHKIFNSCKWDRLGATYHKWEGGKEGK